MKDLSHPGDASSRQLLTFWKLVAAAIFLIGAYATVVRFTQGLGPSTNLDDTFPWGIWIGFDVMVGVGLAAGGFTIAGTVHVFQLHDYEPVARPAILTALLGYVLVCVGLLFDLGQPWDIWHPLIMWNPHSVMFEVAWCVMIYTTVLVLEFSPAVLERFGLKTPLKIVRKFYIVLVIAGVMLSMMHQSSLGTLFLIAPDKLHPLWYTPWLPVFFFITAIAAGISMTIVESYLSHRAFKRELEDHLLQGMARAIPIVLGAYLIFKVGDLAIRGNLGLAFDITQEAVLFWGEMGLGVILPIILFLSPSIRNHRSRLFFAAMLTVIGFVVNRLNVAITGMMRGSGASYVPHWMELAITLALVVAGFVGFALAVKYLDVFPNEAEGKDGHASESAKGQATTQQIGSPSSKLSPTANRHGLGVLWGLAVVGLVLVIFADAREAQSMNTSVGTGASAGTSASGSPSADADADADADARASHVDVTRFKMPEPHQFPRHRMSPGSVVFRHDTHVDLAAPAESCTGCHQHLFKLRKAGETRGGSFDHVFMDQGDGCGFCHDGNLAFSTKDSCERCH